MGNNITMILNHSVSVILGRTLLEHPSGENNVTHERDLTSINLSITKHHLVSIDSVLTMKTESPNQFHQKMSTICLLFVCMFVCQWRVWCRVYRSETVYCATRVPE